MAVRKKKKKPVKRRSHAKVKRAPRRKVAARPKKRRVTAKKSKPRKRKRVGKRVVKQVERSSVERTLTGKRRQRSTTRRRHHPRKRRIIMAGRRSRSVGKKGNMGLLLGLGIGALAIYMLTRPKTPTYNYPNLNQLPPLTQTSNYQRNDQTNSILNYALAASLGIDAITKLISSLNNSSDDQVKNIYDHVETTGSLPDTVYV